MTSEWFIISKFLQNNGLLRFSECHNHDSLSKNVYLLPHNLDLFILFFLNLKMNHRTLEFEQKKFFNSEALEAFSDRVS